MSYATDVLRRRQEMERAFRPRYNPMEDVVSALSEIDKEAFRREQIAAEEKRSVEKYGLEKERILAETKKLNQDRSASEAALANQREGWAEAARQRAAEFQARTAEERRKTKQAEEERAAKVAAEQVFGKMQREGLTSKDIFTTKTMGEDLAGVVAAHGGETPAMKVGTTMKDIEEIADASGVPADVLMSMVQVIESEREKMGASLGLTGARTEEALTRADLNRRRGIKGPPSAAQVAKEADEAFKRALSIQFEKLKIREKELKLGAESGFTLTPEVMKNIQEARIAAKAAQSGMNALRALLKKYPDLETYTGPLDNMEAWVRQKFGAQGQEQAEIRATIDQVFQAFKRIQTGAAAGNQEMADLKSIMPSTTDQLPAIKGKMEASDNIVRQQVSYYDRLLKARDIRAGDEFATGADIVAPTAAPAAAQMSDDELDQYEVR